MREYDEEKYEDNKSTKPAAARHRTQKGKQQVAHSESETIRNSTKLGSDMTCTPAFLLSRGCIRGGLLRLSWKEPSHALSHMAHARRRLCTQQPKAPSSSKEGISPGSSSDAHIPPLVIRLALVGSTVGLTTPLFVAAGAFRIWTSFLMKSTEGRTAKYIIGIIAGGGTVKVMCDYVLPFLRDHSNVIAPFAFANAVTSMFWYGVGEIAFGKEFVTNRLDTQVVGI